MVQIVNIGGDQRRSHTEDTQVAPQLPTFEYGAEVAQQRQVIQVKVDAEQQHKYGNDHLTIGGVAADTVCLNAKAAGACGAKGMHQCVKQGHFAAYQEDDFHCGEKNINQIENTRGLFGPRHQLAYNGTGHFRPQYVNGAIRNRGNDGHNKDKHTHTAHPVGKAAPH